MPLKICNINFNRIVYGAGIWKSGRGGAIANDAQLVYVFCSLSLSHSLAVLCVSCHVILNVDAAPEKSGKSGEKRRKMQSKYRWKSRAKSKPTIFFRIISVGLLLSAQSEREIV